MSQAFDTPKDISMFPFKAGPVTLVRKSCTDEVEDGAGRMAWLLLLQSGAEMGGSRQLPHPNPVI